MQKENVNKKSITNKWDSIIHHAKKKIFMNGIVIREIRECEIEKLEDMLYEAIYQPDEQTPIPRSVLNVPEVYSYIKDFGKSKDDYCLVADFYGKIVGAVWVRILSAEPKGYGYINEETPEFAISLFKEYRNQGIGTNLTHIAAHQVGNRYISV